MPEIEYLNNAVVSITADRSSEQAIVTVTFGECVEMVPGLYMVGFKIAVAGEMVDVL